MNLHDIRPAIKPIPTQYDAIEIAMCVELGDDNGHHYVERVESTATLETFHLFPGETIQDVMYTVYGHLPEGGVDTIADFATWRHAVDYVDKANHGLPVDDFTPEKYQT